jgi:hypothetical protein
MDMAPVLIPGKISRTAFASELQESLAAKAAQMWVGQVNESHQSIAGIDHRSFAGRSRVV